MATPQAPHPTPARTLRQLGWILAGGLALAGHFIGPSPEALWLQLAGAAVFAVATVRPSSMKPLHIGVMFLLRPITYLASWFVGPTRERRPPTRRRRIADTGA